MISFTVDANTAPAIAKLRRIGQSVAKVLAPAVLRAAHLTAGIIGDVLNERSEDSTRQLARSFVANVGFILQTPDTVSARTWSPLPYARIQDQGGTIKPRTAKALSIPLTPEAKKRWPRDWPAEQLFLLILRGKAMLAERVGKKLRVHYVLKDQVTITGKGYIKEAQAKARPKVDQVMRSALVEAVRGA